MNLVSDPWIPVVDQDGTPGNVSLGEVFSRGKYFGDLAVRPHERIALMRLLICVAQAALDGPADRAEWLGCRDRLPQAAENYLHRWQHTFELFGDGQRFLQIPNLTPKPGSEAGTPTTKLDVAMATGNNPTLFDNGGLTERQMPASRLALLLLTFQCFSPGGLIGVAHWCGLPTGNGKSEHAPCVSRSMLHALLRGSNFLETLHLNLLHRQQVQELANWGQPVWESMPESPDDDKARTNATTTYLGRLMPVARAVRLYESGAMMTYANALIYPDMREPSATEVISDLTTGAQRTVLSASLERAIWRELNAITVKSSGVRVGGPLALQNLSGASAFDCWAGGLVASKAKLLDSIESVFHVPAAMLDDVGQNTYQLGVTFAGDVQARLFWAVNSYWREFGRLPASKQPKQAPKEELAHSRTRASSFFWTALEQGVPDLLAVVEEPKLLGVPAAWENTNWGKLVIRTSVDAFQNACPLATPRQMRAYSLALPLLKKNISNDANSNRRRSRKPSQIPT